MSRKNLSEFMGRSLMKGWLCGLPSCHEASTRHFAAMYPRGVAAHQCARAVVSLLFSVVAPVHGGLFHSHTPSSVAAAIATAARLAARRISLRTAVLAHVSCIKSSLTSLSMRSLSQAPNRGFNRGSHEIS